MTDSTVAACRAALLKVCPEYIGSAHRLDGADFPIDARLVNVDDAAACMAEREAKLRAELEQVMGELGAAGARNARYKVELSRARAALAAAQEGGTDG